jgi:hypothetical protein
MRDIQDMDDIRLDEHDVDMVGSRLPLGVDRNFPGDCMFVD